MRRLLIPMINWETFTSVVVTLLTICLVSKPVLAHGKGLYATEAEAQQRVEEIGCTTSHQNNGRWMPCADEQELHQQLRKQ